MPKHSGSNFEEDQVLDGHDEDNRFDEYDEVYVFPSRSKNRKSRISTRERAGRSKSRKNQRKAFINFSATRTPSNSQIVHISRKKNARIEEREAQLQARKRNIQARIFSAQTQSFSFEEEASYAGYYDFEVLPAAELGIEEGSMYQRLLNILTGEDITPEDYDLLLQLDSTNFRPTLEAEDIDQLPEIVFGSEKFEDLRSQHIVGSCCEICLEEWSADTYVRLLPCKHVFCKGCIDHWFREISTKCPNLGCFWCKDST